MSIWSYEELKREILKRHEIAQLCLHQEFHAARKIQSFYRGYQVRKMVKHWNAMAILIQKSYRGYAGRKVYFILLQDTVQQRFDAFYAQQATHIQRVFRGFWSRKTTFDYYKMKKWIGLVKLKNDELSEETWEYFQDERNRRTELHNNMARDLCIFIARKLHHLLRTHQRAGIYSNSKSKTLTHVEKLLAAFRFKESNAIDRKENREMKLKYMTEVRKAYREMDTRKNGKCQQFRKYRNMDLAEKELVPKTVNVVERPLKIGQITYPFEPRLQVSEKYCDKILSMTRDFEILSPGRDFSLNTKIIRKPEKIEEFLHVLKDYCLLHNLIEK